MENKYPKRKYHRLKNFDYGNPYSYFITICTKDRDCILSEIASIERYCIDINNLNLTDVADILKISMAEKYKPILSEIGKIAENALCNIPSFYPNVSVCSYVIMPNHIHLILKIHSDYDNETQYTANIGKIINSFKGYVTKQVGKPIWQKSFYDHVIRNKYDFDETVSYVNKNAMRWYKRKEIRNNRSGVRGGTHE